jgi:hypothetical protein
MVAKIATGEIEEKAAPKSAAAELGSKGGRARAAALSKKKRTETRDLDVPGHYVYVVKYLSPTLAMWLV